MADRWERQRSAWVLARAGRNPSARRRGERLAARARRLDRYEAGAGDQATAEVYTRNWASRWVMREEGTANRLGWAVAAAAWAAVRVVVAGPALVLAWGGYGLWWWRSTRWGPLRWEWPTTAAAVVMPIVGGLGWVIADPTGMTALLTAYALVQLTLGLARLGWLARAYGWPAAEYAARPSQAQVAPIRIDVAAQPDDAHQPEPQPQPQPAAVVVIAPHYDDAERI